MFPSAILRGGSRDFRQAAGDDIEKRKIAFPSAILRGGSRDKIASLQVQQETLPRHVSIRYPARRKSRPQAVADSDQRDSLLKSFHPLSCAAEVETRGRSISS